MDEVGAEGGGAQVLHGDENHEPHEVVYFKLFESQLPVVEKALYVASRMVGTERSRGYCLELVCAAFLRGEESSPEGP